MLKRLTSLVVPILVLAVLVHEILHTPIYTDRELAAFREQNVALAKNGQFDDSLRGLKALSEIAPEDAAVWGDYLTVLVWAGRDAEAVQLTASPNLPPLPDYALAELFEAALRIGHIASAQHFALAEIAQSNEPEKVAVTRVDRLQAIGADSFTGAVIEAGLARVPQSPPLLARLNPQPEPLAAETEIAQLATVIAPDSAPAPLLAAHVGDKSTSVPQKSNRPTSTNNSVTRAKKISPSMNASKYAAMNPASTEKTNTESALSERQISAEQARRAVQAAEVAPRGERKESAVWALAALDSYIELLNNESPPDREALRNAKLDRVRALTLAGQLQDAATLFESLGDPQALPVYGLLNGADAYAQLQQPERALPLLEIAQSKAPDDASVLSALFYNQLDRERYDLAAQTLAQLQRVAGDKVVDGRAPWTARLAAMLAAYQNHLASAQQQLEALRAQAPHDPELELNLATIYRWRGWGARALQEYKNAGDDGADPIAVQTGSVQSQFDLRRFREAGEGIAGLATSMPDHPDTLALQSRWDWFNRYEYIAQVMTGQSGNNPVTGSSDLTFEQWLYSQPILDHYRIFAHQRYDWADFPEGSGNTNRTALGGDYRSEPFDVAIAGNARAPGGRLGVALNGEWRPAAHWSLFGDAQSDSQLVPLRGLRAGIDGYSSSIGVGYRWDEARSARVALSRAEFSDGEYRNGEPFAENTRQTVAASISQSVWSDAQQRVALNGEVYYSHNSADANVPYFNPASDRSLQIGADYNGILTRQFARTWSQRVAVGLGMYEQQNFDRTPIWSVEYEQRWAFGPALSINYGALYRSRVYDGGREGYSALFAGVDWRF